MFNRSRPWRARGPSLGTRAGSRRRGRLDDGQSSVPSPPTQNDVHEEFPISDYAAAADGVSVGPAPVTASLFAEQISAARIDEAGLRAMAWRAQEQAQTAACAGQTATDEMIVSSPLEFLIPVRSDLMVISRSRRSG